MSGAAISYYALKLDPNYSDQSMCVYNFLLRVYSKHIKDLSEEQLRHIFFEEEMMDDTGDIPFVEDGVSTEQIKRELYRISRMRLTYISMSFHMYPVLDEELRRSIFSTEKQQASKKDRVFRRTSTKIVFDNSLPTVFDLPFSEIEKLDNVNLVYKEVRDLTDLVIHLANKEHVIYKTRTNAGKIVRIEYKDNVTIEVNKHYEAKLACETLVIPFKRTKS
ncbi:UNVERIFIED_CONTAM: hypothetical protein HDU68_002093 [Siphonaria sp. JEL0065]|nr:hypothetical protein HDU68_002093 [Siphonaria sp. JEL0065]